MQTNNQANNTSKPAGQAKPTISGVLEVIPFKAASAKVVIWTTTADGIVVHQATGVNDALVWCIEHYPAIAL